MPDRLGAFRISGPRQRLPQWLSAVGPVAARTDRRHADVGGCTGGAMRVTISLLGHTLDVSLTADTAAEDDADEGAALNGGTCASTPTTHFGRWEIPDEAALPDRNNGWGDEGNRA